MNNIVPEIAAMSLYSTGLFFLLLSVFKLFKHRITENEKYHMELFAIAAFMIPVQKLAYYMTKLLPDSVEQSGAALANLHFVQESFMGNSHREEMIISEPVHVLFFIWAAGFSVMAAVQLIQSIRCFRAIEKNSSPVTERHALELYRKQIHSMGLMKAPELCSCTCLRKPVVLRYKGYKILIPQGYPLSEDTLELILCHELTHYAGRDLLYKALLNVVSAMHWFNPMLIFIKKEFERRCELACDERVLRGRSIEERIKYGDLIVRVSALEREHADGMLSFSGNKNLIKERLMRIAKEKGVNEMEKKRMLPKILLAGIVALFFITAAVSYAGAANGQEAGANGAAGKQQQVHSAVVQKKVTGQGEKQRVELSIPIEEIDQIDCIRSQKEWTSRTLESITIGEANLKKQRKVLQQVSDQFYSYINPQEMVWVTPATSVKEQEPYKYKGQIVFSFR